MAYENKQASLSDFIAANRPDLYAPQGEANYRATGNNPYGIPTNLTDLFKGQSASDWFAQNFPGDQWSLDPNTNTVSYKNYGPTVSDALGGLLFAGPVFGMAAGAAAGAGLAGEAGSIGAADTGLATLESGAGASGIGAETGLTTAGAGAGAGAGSITDVADNIYNPTTGVGTDAGAGAGAGSGTGIDVFNQPPTTNLQDMITKFDSLPGGTGTAAKTLLGRILDGSGTSDDLLKLVGLVGPSVLGAIGSSQQTGALTDLANKFAGYGAPYRDQLSALMKDPSSFYSSPEAAQAFDAMARKLSVGGNPAGDPYKQATLTGGLYSLLQGKENQLAGFGGLTAYNAAAPGALTSAVGSNANLYNAIGSGLGNVLNPPNDLQSLLAAIGKGNSINFGSGYSGLG